MSTVKKIPQRQCIGCGEMKNKKEMIRVLKTADDEIVIDATGRKNGRGAYICPSMDCFRKAVKRKGLERSFKMAIPKEVYERLEKEMERIDGNKKILNLIGLATKAGKAPSGEFSTEKAVKEGKAAMVIVSEEAFGTRRKCSGICVLTMKFPSIISGKKRNWATRWGKR